MGGHFTVSNNTMITFIFNYYKTNNQAINHYLDICKIIFNKQFKIRIITV